MKRDKKIVIIVAFMLGLIPMFAGCIDSQDLVIFVPYQNIGDQIIYDITMTTVSSSDGSESTTQTLTGTQTSQVIGMTTITDGFGYEKDALEITDKYVFSLDSDQTGLTGELTTDTYQYYDTDSKTPIKVYSNIDTDYSLGSYSQSFSFYYTEQMNELISSSFTSGSTPGVSTFSPTDIISGFEGKSIKNGDTGTITIGSIDINYEAVGNENVQGYDCIKIRFTLDLSPSESDSLKITVSSVYNIWLTDTFPTLIKLDGEIDTTSESTLEYFEGMSSTSTSTSTISMEMILKESSSGDTAINWGTGTLSFADNNIYGEYLEWDVLPEIGTKPFSYDFTADEAIVFGENNSPDFANYLSQHADAYILSAQYSKSDQNMTWDLSYIDQTTLGYNIVVKDYVTESITSVENTTYSQAGKAKDTYPEKMLTFTGAENILSQYATYDTSSDKNIYYLLDLETLGASTVTSMTSMQFVYDLFPSSFYTVTIGNLLSFSSEDVVMAFIDAENGQVILTMEISMSMPIT